MTLDEILTLIDAVEKTDFDTFEVKDEEFSLKLERKNYHLALEREGTPIFIGNTAATPAPSGPEPQALEALPDAAVEEAPANSKEITSPLIGVFHKLPEGKAVKAGDQMKKGDVICMVEAMKLMNEILMPEDGEIVWAGVEDNTMVEFGDLLYRYV